MLTKLQRYFCLLPFACCLLISSAFAQGPGGGAGPTSPPENPAYRQFVGQASAPSAPPSGRFRLFVDTSGDVKLTNSANVTTQIVPAGGAIGGTGTAGQGTVFSASQTLVPQGGAVYYVTSSTAGADFGAKLATAQTALSALSSTGGVIDARGIFGAQSLSADFTITQKNMTILLGPITLTMGTNRIIISQGVNGVSILGVGAWGGSGGANTAAGTHLAYTGTGSAIVIGSSAGDTQMVYIGNLAIALTGANAIGVTVNSAQHTTLERVRIGAPASGTTSQTLIKLDGTGDYTAYTMIRECWLSNGTTGILITGTSGHGSNSNQIIGGSYAGLVGSSTAVSILFSDGNSINGTDIENALVGIAFASNSTQNMMPMVRFETVTTAVTFASGSNNNRVDTPRTGLTVTDNGTGNSVLSTGTFSVTNAGLLTVASNVVAGGNLVGSKTGVASVGGFSFRDSTTGADSTALINIADGQFALSNAALNNVTALNWGPNTASFFEIKRSGTTAQFRLGDDSADAPVTALSFNGLTLASNSLNSAIGTGLQIGGAGMASDAAAGAYKVFAQSAWSQATVNTTGANLTLAPGIGRRFYTSVSNVAGAVTVTTTVDGTAVALASGVDFTLGSDDTAPQLAVTATNLAAAINANSTLNVKVTATASAAKVFLDKVAATTGIQIATNQSGRVSVTSGADGLIVLGSDAVGPMLAFGGTTSSFPGLIASGTSLQLRPANNSGFTNLQLNSLVLRTSGGTVQIPSNGLVNFSSTTDGNGSKDLGLYRNGIGVLEVNTGTAGVFADIKFANMTASGATITWNNAAFFTCTALNTNGSGVMGCTASDERLKQNLQPFTRGLEAIRGLKPTSYQFLPTAHAYNNGQHYSGFVAQQVQKFIPEAISAQGTGILQIDTVTLVATLTNAIKELDREVQRQAAELSALKARLLLR